MIKVIGNVMKSEIANAIQHYNKAPIYSYGDWLPCIEDCYHVYDSECSLKEFCQFVYDDIEKRILENETFSLNKMCVIYTNLEHENDKELLEIYAEEIEKMGYVGTVVIMTK